jgi:D-xylose transport system permease protein
MTADTDTASSSTPAASGFDNDNRQAATIGDSARDYVNRLRGGDMGSLPAILGLIFLFVVFASLNDRFLTTYNMANLVIQAGSICVMAMGIVFVLLLGEIDLSAGVAGGACATITALMLIDYDWTWWLATLAGVAVGALIGTAIGALVSFLGIPSFVVTLAFFLALQAVPLRLIGSGGSLRYDDPVLRGLSIKNVPVTAGWIAAILIVVGFAALSLWRYRTLSAKGLVHQPIGLVAIRIAVLAVVVLGLTALLNANRAPNPNFTIAGIPWVAPVVIALLLFWTSSSPRPASAATSTRSAATPRPPDARASTCAESASWPSSSARRWRRSAACCWRPTSARSRRAPAAATCCCTPWVRPSSAAPACSAGGAGRSTG